MKVQETSAGQRLALITKTIAPTSPTGATANSPAPTPAAVLQISDEARKAQAGTETYGPTAGRGRQPGNTARPLPHKHGYHSPTGTASLKTPVPGTVSSVTPLTDATANLGEPQRLMPIDPVTSLKTPSKRRVKPDPIACPTCSRNCLTGRLHSPEIQQKARRLLAQSPRLVTFIRLRSSRHRHDVPVGVLDIGCSSLCVAANRIDGLFGHSLLETTVARERETMFSSEAIDFRYLLS